MHPLELKININREDHFAWKEYVLFNSKAFKRNRALFALVFPVFVVILLGYKWMMQDGKPLETLVFLGIAGLWAKFYPKRYEHLFRSRMRRRLESDKDLDKHLGEHSYRLDDSGIQVVTNLSESHIRWDDLSDYIETDGHIFLLLSQQAALPFPKEQISGADLQTLREYCSLT